MPSREGYTTVEMKKRTRDRLVDIGKKNETYDDIINMLVDLFLKERK